MSQAVSRSLALLLGLLPAACLTPDTGAEGEPGASTAGAPQLGAQIATITALRGRGGVTATGLPEGSFLGEGGHLKVGQTVGTPKGLRAEIELEDGSKLRLDELASVALHADRVELLEGRVMIIGGAGPASLAAADERLDLDRGRAQVTSRDGKREYSVLEGHATLTLPDRTVDMNPGALIETPIETTATGPVAPTVSLAPLHDSGWAREFERAKALATTLPPGVGSLTARRPNSQSQSQPLRITDQRVRVTIKGRVAHTEIEQAFHNDAGQELEGTYRFPLPGDASISGLQLLVGSRWMEGEMLEKTRARAIFKSIVDRVIPRDPALLEWEQGSVFKLKVFPIPPHGERRVRLSYTQRLPDGSDGTMKYRYPMGGTGAGDTTIGNFDFQVMVDGQTVDPARLAEIRTPMLDLHRDTVNGHVRLSHHAAGYVPTHELGVDLPAPPSGVVSHVDRDGQAYFMLDLEPKFTAVAPTAVDYAFVVDRSHGTAPELWAAASGLVRASIAGLSTGDRFTVLACDTACDPLGPGVMEVNANTEAAVERFLGSQPLGGASDVGAMLLAGAAALPARPGAARVVVYLGDGVATSGELAADDIIDLTRSERFAGVQIQAVAMGARADTLVLDALARNSGGDMITAGVSDDLDSVARELQLRARVPAFTDLALDLPPSLYDVHPRVLPAVRPGERVTVIGKIRPDAWGSVSGDAVLRRVSTGEAVRAPVAIQWGAPRQHPYLPRAWAAEEIAWLTTSAGHDAKAQIVRLSEEYTVMSRYTALLVLENDAMFRQHRVARRANAKDRWRGELPALPPGANAAISAQVATGSTAATSGPLARAGGIKLGGNAGPLAAAADEDVGRGQGLLPPSTQTWSGPDAWPSRASDASVAAERSAAQSKLDALGGGHAGREATKTEEARPVEEALPTTPTVQSPRQPAPDPAPEMEAEEGDWFGEANNERDSQPSGSAAPVAEPADTEILEKSREGAETWSDLEADEKKGEKGPPPAQEQQSWTGDPFGGDARDRAATAEDEPATDDFDDFEGDDEWAAFPGERRESAKKLKKKATSAPRPASKSKSAKYSDASGVDGLLDPSPGRASGKMGTSYGGGGYYGGPYSQRPRPKPRPRLHVTAESGASSKTLDRLARLLAQRDGDRDDRARHRSLVTAALRAGDVRAGAWAAEWAEADPDHGSALTARADALHRDGHAMAARAYESAAEARPFDRTLHEHLALALESKGQFERACSHRRAVVSIDPARGRGWVELAECLARGGDVAAGGDVLRVGQLRATSSQSAVQRALAGDRFAIPDEVSLHGSADIRAELTWSGPADLDIVLVDSRGRRISAMRPESGVRVRERAGQETLTWRKLKNSMVLEVTRVDGGTEPVAARLVVRTPDGRRSFDVTIVRGTQRLARVYRK